MGRTTGTGVVCDISPAVVAARMAALPDGIITYARATHRRMRRMAQGWPIGRAFQALSALALFLMLASCMSGCAVAASRAIPTPRPPQITEFPVPTLYNSSHGDFTVQAETLISGPDDNLWFTAGGLFPGAMDPIAGGVIGRLSLGGDLSLFQTPTRFYSPAGITAGQDGNMWFTQNDTLPDGTVYGAMLGRITPAGAFSEVPINVPVTANSAVTANGIAQGADGQLWFTLQIVRSDQTTQTCAIGEMSLSGQLLHTFALPDTGCEMDTSAIGPDGNLWFTVTHVENVSRAPTQVRGSWIGEIAPSGATSKIPLPETQGFPSAMATGPDGNLWVAMTLPGAADDYTDSALLRVTPAGRATEFRPLGAHDTITGVVAGPDGNLWFTHDVTQSDGVTHVNSLARFTMRGVVTEFALGTSSNYPGNLVIGPDHALWFIAGAAIGRVG